MTVRLRLRGMLGLGAAWLGVAATAVGAQQGEVTGRVTYAGSGVGIAGVLMVLPELNLGRTTDAQGRFRIELVAPGRHELFATLLGCQLGSRSIDLAAGQHLDVRFDLSSPVINLQGIVVTALASETPEAQLPFSVGRLDPGVSDAAPQHSVGSLIQGRVAGATVLYGTGQPGSEPSIQLRGPRSIQQGQAPLVVVDGVITQGGVSDLNPLDVERVEILRGASAAASYGSRGQSGVIEITTKRGPSNRPRSQGPLIVVDGTPIAGTLADVDATAIEEIRKFDGPAAAVLYGPRAEAGVIQVSTRGAPPDASRPPFCVVPAWIR